MRHIYVRALAVGVLPLTVWLRQKPQTASPGEPPNRVTAESEYSCRSCGKPVAGAQSLLDWLFSFRDDVVAEALAWSITQRGQRIF